MKTVKLYTAILTKKKRRSYEFIEEHVGFQNAVHDRTVFYDQSDSYLVEYIQLHNECISQVVV